MLSLLPKAAALPTLRTVTPLGSCSSRTRLNSLGAKEREREQRSPEFGIKLAKVLRHRAQEVREEFDLDPRYVILGAAEYLRETAESQIDPPLDEPAVDPNERFS